MGYLSDQGRIPSNKYFEAYSEQPRLKFYFSEYSTNNNVRWLETDIARYLLVTVFIKFQDSPSWSKMV